MTNPTADAAKLLPCPSVICPSHHPAWDAGNVSDLRHETPGYRVKCAECDASTGYYAHGGEAITVWNTRPQPAPPEGEPDFAKLAEDICELMLNEISFDAEDECNWISTHGRVKLNHLLRTAMEMKMTNIEHAVRMAQHMLVDHLPEQALRIIDEAIGGCCSMGAQSEQRSQNHPSAALRPKVEDAPLEVKQSVEWLRGLGPFGHRAADLLERLARDRDDENRWLRTTTLYAQYKETEAKLAEREAELADTRKDFDINEKNVRIRAERAEAATDAAHQQQKS